ncbi:MAG TPA: radical SAM protein [Thermodesulfobacteriota bacterium]
MPGPEIATVRARTILTPAVGYVSGGYTHTLNPYQGCGFGADLTDLSDAPPGDGDAGGRGDRGCPYCYVRRMPLALFGRGPWGSWVTAKVNAADLVREEGRRGRLALARIFLGSATDPYQFVAENRFRLTRAVLEALVDYPPAHVTVQTRSPLVERDFDLLVALGSRVRLSMTIETDDEAVRRAITPTTPPAARRLESLRRARALGIETQAAIAPVLPCRPERFADLVAEVADRVYLDSLWVGDGARGARSAALGMPRRLRAIGRGDWVSRDAHLPLYHALVARMGEARVHAAEARTAQAQAGGSRPSPTPSEAGGPQGPARPAPARPEQFDFFTLDPRFAPRRDRQRGR